MPTFSVRARELRRSKNLTQKQIASIFGVSEILWRKYEAGDRVPTLDGLIAIADYFGVSIDYLVGRTDNPQRL